MKHTLTTCQTPEPLRANQQYIYKGWKQRFVCPVCGRETWQHLNFLGRRFVACNGEKFSKIERIKLCTKHSRCPCNCMYRTIP